jgi:pyrimidine operon attenuation protein / uracil phosphoribosyltransferase
MTECLFDEAEIKAAIEKMGKEIAETLKKENCSLLNVCLIGLLPNGIHLAKRLSHLLASEFGQAVAVGKLDVSLFRDPADADDHFVSFEKSVIPMALTDKHVILVDDVLFHGKDIRAALEAILDYGRPSCVELAVLWDRGHRRLPILAHYTGLKKTMDINDKYSVLLYESAAQDRVEKRESSEALMSTDKNQNRETEMAQDPVSQTVTC